MPLSPDVTIVGFFHETLFSYKAGRVLDLCEGFWQDKPLGKRDYIISADEKTSIQARKRKHDSLGPKSRQAMRIEHEYERKGARADLDRLCVKLSYNEQAEKGELFTTCC